MSRTIRFVLTNTPFERRGEIPRGMVVFKTKKKSPKGGRQGERLKLAKEIN